MKKFKVILIFLLIQIGLRAQTFQVTVDTMFLDIKEIARPASRIDMTHAVKYNEKYYCFFKENRLYSLKNRTRYFLIISNNGTILNTIEVPKEIENTVYFDFFIRNDSLLAKKYMSHESFYFNIDRLEWGKIKEVNDIVYEDTNFAITYLDFGEWGQSTWFIDKQIQNEYVIGAQGTNINKLDGKYYLTTGSEILEIENPRHLEQCDKGYYYREVEKERKSYQGSNSLIGSKIIYKDTTFSSWTFKEPKQIIITSFVTNNQLYLLYSDTNSTYIGKIEKEKLIPFQNIGKKYSTFNWHYSYRGNNLDNNSRFIKFRENNNTYGFIEINNNKVNIKYLIHNQDSLNYIGSNGFGELFKLILINANNISIEQVDSLENSIKGVDMRNYRTGISHNGYYPEIYATQDVKTKRFIKVEDKLISQATEYLYTTQGNLVRSIFIEWTLTEPYNQTNSFKIFSDNKPEVRERFQLKLKEIEAVITNLTNLKPEKEDRGNDYIKLTWSLENGIVIKLYGSESFKGKKEIRMIIDIE